MLILYKSVRNVRFVLFTKTLTGKSIIKDINKESPWYKGSST